jgi:hypothetical protein
VRRFGDGRSEKAGYVQVIQGHIDDLDRMASLGRDQEELLAREAPHILGVTVAEHADRPGDFTQILYFTFRRDLLVDPPTRCLQPVGQRPASPICML